jgi:hypothetical protein
MSKKLIAIALAGLFVFSVGSFKAFAADENVCVSIDLKYGMKDSQVSILQTQLKSDPTVYPEGLVTGYFGPLTLKAVKAFQAKYNIITTGYVGPLTRGKLTELYCPATTGLPEGCTSTTGFSPTTGHSCAETVTYPEGCTSTTGFSTTTGHPCSETVTLPAGCTSTTGFSPTTGQSCAGTTTTTVAPSEGYFTFKQLASPANLTSAKKGTTNTAVLAFTLKANNSDISLKTIKLGFNVRPWRYISKISLYEGSNLLKEVEAVSSAFEEVTVGSSYNLYLTGLDVPILKGETKTFTYKVDVPASPETTGTVTLTLASNAIRGVDTVGLNVYAAGETRTFTTAAATTGALELSINSGATKDKVELISTTDTTEHVTLATFDLKAKYNDIHITEINNVTLVKHSSNTLDKIILAAELWDGDTMLGSVTPGTNGTDADFTSLDIDIAKDATKTLTIKGSIAKIDAAATKEGDYTNVTLDASAANIVCEDSLYNPITATGSLTGKNVYFYTVAPVLTFVSSDIKLDENLTDNATGHITFTVKALGGPIYFYDDSTTTKAITIAAIGSTGSAVAATGQIVFSTGTVIAAGTATTTINSTSVSQAYATTTTNMDTGEEVANALAGKINADGTLSTLVIAATTTDNDGIINLTAKTAGYDGNSITYSATTTASTGITVTPTTATNLTGGLNAIASTFAYSVTGHESDSSYVYKIAQNTTATVSVTTHLDNNGGTAGMSSSDLTHFLWGSADSAPTANDWTWGLETFHTDDLYLSS